MFSTCINNDNWFGTIEGEYKVLAGGIKTLKDITCTSDDYSYEFYLVIDDCGEPVEIPANNFRIGE